MSTISVFVYRYIPKLPPMQALCIDKVHAHHASLSSITYRLHELSTAW